MLSNRLSPGGWKDPPTEMTSFNRAAKGCRSSASAFDAVCTTHTIQVTYTMLDGSLGSPYMYGTGPEVCLVPCFAERPVMVRTSGRLLC